MSSSGFVSGQNHVKNGADVFEHLYHEYDKVHCVFSGLNLGLNICQCVIKHHFCALDEVKSYPFSNHVGLFIVYHISDL